MAKDRTGIAATLKTLSPLHADVADTSGHPLSASEFSFSAPDDLLEIDPREIVLEGPYVRHADENDPDFQVFVEAIKKNRDIGQPVAVRTAGGIANRRYILVWGMRRWKAALHAGLTRVPARNLGPIDEAESLRWQVKENDLRTNPHVVDRAYGYFMINLHSGGASQVELAREYGTDQGRLSILIRMGEAIHLLSEEERARLYRPDITYRLFQEIVRGNPAAEVRKKRLLEALAQLEGQGNFRRPAKPSSNGKGGAADPVGAMRERNVRRNQPFDHQDHRDGRTWRMRIQDKHLREDPEGLVGTLQSELATEITLLVDRLRGVAEGESGAVAERAARALAELDRLRKAVAG